MANNRLDAVVSSMVEGVRDALSKHDVTFEEYREGVKFLMDAAQAGEIPLLVDLFFNTTIVSNINDKSHGTVSDLEGPYFLEDSPIVEDKIKTQADDRNQPLVLRGTVSDTDGTPIEGAEVHIWSSTPDGTYGGIHPGVPADTYRGRQFTKGDGGYKVETTVPVPYQIKNDGPTGALLEKMGRHSWRPAHVHFKIRADGYQELTTQAYFAGGDWVDDDCCEGSVSPDLVIDEIIEDGKRIMPIDFKLDPATQQKAA